MKIGFDAKRAFLNQSGLGNYSRSLITSLVQNHPQLHYSLYTPKAPASPFLDYISKQQNVQLFQPKSGIVKKFPAFWRSFEITNLLINSKQDVYHGLSNELPANIRKFNGKKIVTIHDLIFLRFPELYPIIDRQIYDRKFRKSCEYADCVIAISEQTKKDVIEFYRIPERKIKVVYQSCDSIFYREITDEALLQVKQKYKLPDEFLFSVGTIEERKNLLTILKALKSVRDIKLVIVGRKRAYFKVIHEYIQQNNLEPRVLFLENVSTEELPALYRLAKIFIYPSLFEGFGIPVLEALSCKTPVIATGSSSLPEAGGSNSLYIDATNHNQLAELIDNFLRSASLRNNAIEKGYEHSKKFRPEVIAQEMMKIYSA